MSLASDILIHTNAIRALNNRRASAEATAIDALVTPATGGGTTPPPTGIGASGNLTANNAPILLTASRVLNNLKINPGSAHAQQAISAEGVSVSYLEAHNCLIQSIRYGLWSDRIASTLLDHCTFDTGGGGSDGYCCRGSFSKWRSNDCIFKNHGEKAVVRILDCVDGISWRDLFESTDRMLLGGGWADEHVSYSKLQNFMFKDGWLNVHEMEIYAPQNVVFDNMNFAGTDWISQHGGGVVTYHNCRNVPDLRRYENAPAPIVT